MPNIGVAAVHRRVAGLVLLPALGACCPGPAETPAIGELRYQLLRLRLEARHAIEGDTAAVKGLPARREEVDALFERLAKPVDAGKAWWGSQGSEASGLDAGLGSHWRSARSSVDRILARQSDLIALHAAAGAATRSLLRARQYFRELALHLLEEPAEPRQVFRSMELALIMDGLVARIGEVRTGELSVDGGHWGLERTWAITQLYLTVLDEGDRELAWPALDGPKARASLAEARAELQSIAAVVATIVESAPWMPELHEARRSLEVDVERMLAATDVVGPAGAR